MLRKLCFQTPNALSFWEKFQHFPWTSAASLKEVVSSPPGLSSLLHSFHAGLSHADAGSGTACADVSVFTCPAVSVLCSSRRGELFEHKSLGIFGREKAETPVCKRVTSVQYCPIGGLEVLKHPVTIICMCAV